MPWPTLLGGNDVTRTHQENR